METNLEESPSKTPRIKDVAREAGVSTATVSHVINKTKYVTDRTRASVLKAIEECNYYPNAQARSLASGRTDMIGLLVSDIANPFYREPTRRGPGSSHSDSSH